MPQSLPPLPQLQGAGSVPRSSPASSSAFSGLAGLMKPIQDFEAAAQAVASALPSLAPIVAEAVTKIRMAVPNAVSTVAGAQDQGSGAVPNPAAQNALPTPPQ